MAKRRRRKLKRKETREIGGVEFKVKDVKRGAVLEFSKFLDRHYPKVSPRVARGLFGVDKKKFERAGGWKRARDEFFRKYFNRSAPILYPLLTSRETYLTIMRSLIRNLRFRGDEKIMSVGSGTGLIETFLAKRYLKRGEVYSLDFAKGMHAEAKRIAKEEGVENVHFIRADAKHLPIKTKKIDYLISIDTLHWIKNYPRAFDEMMRVMSKKPKSKLIFTFTPGHKRSDISLERIYDIAEKYGMEVTKHGLIPTEAPIGMKAMGEMKPGGRLMMILEPKKAFKEKHSKK